MTSRLRAPAKAVIPAAGLGRRLRPITDVLPKEMFPVGRHPAIEWVIAEAVVSGCTDLAVVISPRKQIIEEYLMTCCPDLMKVAHVSFLIQPEPLGLGHALLLAGDFCEGQAFAVLLPDNLVDGARAPLLEMRVVFEAKGGVVFALTQESVGSASPHGRFELRHEAERVYEVEAILARTTPVSATPRLVGVGRYLFSPECLDYAALLFNRRRAGEFDDGVILQHMLDAGEPVHGVHIEGRGYDISAPEGYTAAWRRFGRRRPTYRIL